MNPFCSYNKNDMKSLWKETDFSEKVKLYVNPFHVILISIDSIDSNIINSIDLQ